MRQIPPLTVSVTAYIGGVREERIDDGRCLLTLDLLLEGTDGKTRTVPFPVTREQLEEWTNPIVDHRIDYRFLPLVLMIHRPEFEVQE